MPRVTKRTLRKMSPIARELAKLANEQASINRRLMNLVAKVESAEHDQMALGAYLATANEDKGSDSPQ